jgi:glycosyltransferase involved in cell wall biosynthesis
MTSSVTSPVRIVVFDDGPGDRYRAGRTTRALRGFAQDVETVCNLVPGALAARLAAAPGPVWLVRAGAWPADGRAVALPPASDTGLPVCALGAWRAEPGIPVPPDCETAKWAAFLAETGGDWSHLPGLADRLPPLASVYLDTPPTARLAQRLGQGEELTAALRAVIGGAGQRVVRYSPLDVYCDRTLRVVQLVTSLQRGGAERVTLSLVRELTALGTRIRLIALSKPNRAPFATPAGTVDLSGRGGCRTRRLEIAARAALAFSADLVHGHLLDAADVTQLSGHGLPMVLTVHNARPGWPAGLEALRAGDAALLIGCARAVEAELRAAGLPFPTRTVWNGIDFAPFERTPALGAAAQEWRGRLGIGPSDWVLLALANPRPQKRLHLLPAIVAATRAEFARHDLKRQVRLVIAGETARANAAAVESLREVEREVARLGLGACVHLVDGVNDVAPLLAAADLLVSTSAYEGLSLAELEALAAGLPVVATDTGGTAEVAHDNPAVFLLPPDAGAEPFAATIARLAQRPCPSGRTQAAVHFTRRRMAEGYARLYPRVLAAGGRARPEGLWLITNNLSTGGAQSSARRLLTGLAAAGVRVRAAVLEEEEAYPTPGRRALVQAGIPVRVLPRAGTGDPADAVARLLESIDDDPPQAVLLWNVIPEYKILLADGLLDIPLFDVSPGEMYYASLERYFLRPRPGLPYRSATDYGARLAGVIVKYRAEAAQAARTLEAPVHVIPNGVPLDVRPRVTRPVDGRLVIGTLARISPQKKLEDLLAAVRQAEGRLPPYLLRIAGGVERGAEAYAKELKRRAEGLCVQWVGEVADDRPFLQGLGLFALVAEPAGCPNASLEAMAQGLAVVATDVGGMAEQVEDGVTGRLTPRGDVAALANALVEMAGDPQRRTRYGAAGRARAETLFDLQRMIADYRRVCLGERAGRPGARPAP